MNIISNFISENLINALGWTLVHSLWQGAAAAVGFALLMVFMRRNRSQTRYYIGVMAVLLVLAMSIVTFIGIYRAGAAGSNLFGITGTVGTVEAGTPGMETNSTISVIFQNYFNRHLPLIVTVWMLGVLVLVLRFAGGFIYNQRLKVHRTRPISTHWQNRLEALCRKIGVDRAVRFVESASIRIPMTIGHFKPVLLFPIGLVTGLPKDQVEALIAHELAHIVRRDYLANIAQNVVDILFFYHPGVRWISSYVRAERENCCDDIAVSVSGDSLNFAKALTVIQETANGFGVKAVEPAVAASGKRFGLLARVKRLLNPPVNRSQFTEGFIGASILAVCILTLVMSTNAAAAMNRGDLPQSTGTNAEEKTDAEIKAKEKAFQEEMEKERIEQSERKKKLEAAFINLEKAKKEMKEKEEELLKLNAEIRSRKTGPTKEEKEKLAFLEDTLNKHKMKVEDLENLLSREKEREIRVKEREFRLQERELRSMEREKRIQEEELRKQERESLEQVKELELMHLEKMKDELKKQEVIMKELEKKLQAAEKDRVKIEEGELVELKEKLEKQKVLLAEKQKMHQQLLVELKSRQMELEKKKSNLKAFEKELLRDKLIAAGQGYEFKLGKAGLYINGVKQSQPLFEKYRELYKKLEGKELGNNDFQIVIDNKD
jgi:bla regulator protein BlaR1